MSLLLDDLMVTVEGDKTEVPLLTLLNREERKRDDPLNRCGFLENENDDLINYFIRNLWFSLYLGCLS